MTVRSGATPRLRRNASWSSPLRSAGRLCVVTATPVCRCASAAAVSTRATSSVMPSSSVTTLIIPANILFEASLSYLGVGVPPETPSWGRQLSDATQWFESAWWMMVFPGVFLLLTTLAFNLVGDGLRDALDPRASAMSYRRVHRRKREREARRNANAGVAGPETAIAVDGST